MVRSRFIAVVAVAISTGSASAWENRQYFMLGGAVVQSALLGAVIVQAVRKRPKKPEPTHEASTGILPRMTEPYAFKDMSLDAK